MNKIGKYLLLSTIPFYSVARAGSAVFGSLQRTAGRVQEAKEVLARQNERLEEAREAEQEEMRLRNADRLTSEEIFERWYVEHHWTEKGLEEHWIMYRRGKFAWLASAVLCLVTMIVAANMHWLLTVMLVSGAAIGVFAFTGRAFLDSLQEARIELRSMIMIREYVGRADFFKRFLT